MKNMVVSMILLLTTTSAFAQSGSMTVCTVNGVKSVNEIRLDGGTMTMTVDGFQMEYIVTSKVALSLQKTSKLVGEQVTDAHQYVITAPQGTGNPAPVEGDKIQLATGMSGSSYMIFAGQGVVASSQACR